MVLDAEKAHALPGSRKANAAARRGCRAHLDGARRLRASVAKNGPPPLLYAMEVAAHVGLRALGSEVLFHGKLIPVFPGGHLIRHPKPLGKKNISGD